MEWTLDRKQVDGIRAARAAVLAAAASGGDASLDAAVAAAVRAMVAAEFSRSTICSLVSAAVDAGLPRRRGDRRRGEVLQRWAERAGALADEIVARAPARDASMPAPGWTGQHRATGW